MDVFENKLYLDKSFVPNNEQYLFRESEKEQIDIVFNSLNDFPSHIMAYGFAGSGKTSMMQMMINDFEFKSNQKAFLINLNNCPTELQAISFINSELGLVTRSRMMSQYYHDLKKYITDYDIKLLFVLDEVDKLLYKSGDSLLYNLLETPNISLVLITNNVMCFDYIEERVKSRMGGLKKLLFKPYNAVEIKEILQHRADNGLTKDVVGNGTINRIASLSAQEHGDLRKAISLLKSCGEIAEKRKTKIKDEYIEMALGLIESDEISDIINSFPNQAKAILYAIVRLLNNTKKPEIDSSELYEEYLKVAKDFVSRTVNDRSIADYIWDMDNSGITQSRVVSHGRYGRTRKIRLGIPLKIATEIIDKQTMLGSG